MKSLESFRGVLLLFAAKMGQNNSEVMVWMCTLYVHACTHLWHSSTKQNKYKPICVDFWLHQKKIRTHTERDTQISMRNNFIETLLTYSDCDIYLCLDTHTFANALHGRGREQAATTATNNIKDGDGWRLVIDTHQVRK